MSEYNSNEAKIIDTPLEVVMKDSMMPYSEHVILERALPRVEDGLKPVQRRILFAMNEMGITPEKPYVKSAKIVGDCLGKYHPHGDTSVYDAMVRLAQDFSMSATLVSGHGNFGSMDGDSAAAMRYTEARLAPLAMQMLKDIDKDTVDWSLNYDDTLKEPNTLPSRFPNLLVNGANGIAVGLATNIPPHNISEVINGVMAYIDNPNITLDEMMEYIKAPDFPTGAEIITGDGLRQAYETGKGKIILRAKMHLEEGEYGKTNIVITELPYQVSKATLLSNILNLRNTKKGPLMAISNIVDESDRNGMRAIITVSKNGDVNEIMKMLLKYTQLESAFNINMVAIADGKPKQLGLMEIIKYYVEYQRSIILRRSQFEYNQAKERAHILQGLVIALHNIDEVIAIIKRSRTTQDAKTELRNRFELSDKQAQAILDMRLAKLAKLEVQKIEEELASLEKLMAKLTTIIKSKAKQMKVVQEEINEIGKAFKTERRSEINGKPTALTQFKLEVEKEPVVDIKGVFTLDNLGRIKLVSPRSYSAGSKDKSGVEKEGMIIEALMLSPKETYYCFTNLGNMARIELDKMPLLPYKEKGVELLAVEENASKDEKVVKVLAVKEEDQEKEIYIFTKNGYVKKSKFSELMLKKSYGDVITLKDDEVIGVEFVEEESTIFFGTKEGLCLNAETTDIPLQGRKAGGVKGIKINDGDSLLYVTQLGDGGEVIVITDKGYAKRVFTWGIEPSARYRKGVKIADVKSGDEIKFYGYVTYPYDIFLELKNGIEKSIIVNSNDIMILPRNNKGKLVVSKGVEVVSAEKMAEQEQNG